MSESGTKNVYRSRILGPSSINYGIAATGSYWEIRFAARRTATACDGGPLPRRAMSST